MNSSIKVRLAAMMFLEYFTWGAWYVTIGTWLSQGLHFSGTQIGLVSGTTAVGAIVSPFVVGWIADTLLATEYLLSILYAVGAVLLYFASSSLTFRPIYLLVLVYACCYMPTISLTNSLSFRHLKDPKTEFGPIRVLGTAGWIAAGLAVGFMKLESTAVPMRIAAAASVVMALFSLVLPHTPPLSRSQGFKISSLLPTEAASLFKERSFVVFALASFIICVPLQFYYALTNLFLNQIGVQNAASKMTGGQMSELACMLLIPWFFRRLGVKYMLAAGMFAWVARYLMFAYGNTGSGSWLLWGGILVHGICYDFFFVTGQIYVDSKASPALRGAAQGIITLITYGMGMLLGSWLSGVVLDHYVSGISAQGPLYQWRLIWLIPAGIAGAVLLLFLLLFRDSSTPQESSSPLHGNATPMPDAIA